MKKFFNKTGDVSLVVLLIMIGLLVLMIVVKPLVFSFNDENYTITVTDKERVADSNNSKYLIFGEDDDGKLYVFENTDAWLRGKFDSSDVYGKIKIGSTYEFTVVGYRVPIFSWYKNIIDYKEISQPET